MTEEDKTFIIHRQIGDEYDDNRGYYYSLLIHESELRHSNEMLRDWAKEGDVILHPFNAEIKCEYCKDTNLSSRNSI